jgi:methionyl-tRNA formyltransferase
MIDAPGDIQSESHAGSPGLSVVFMGTADFSVPALEALVESGYHVALVVTRAARPAGRGRRETQPPIARAAQALGLEVFQPERVRRPEAVERIAAAAPDLIVVAAYGQILPAPILTIPRLQCVNVHASLLPRHRGAAPISAAILKGDPETGITIMLMDEGMDTGPILRKASTPIGDEDDQIILTTRLARMGADLLIETIPHWASGQIEPQVQDSSLATTTRPTLRDDGLLDWMRPAAELWRRIRAFADWPQGFTWWEGKLLRISTASYDESVEAEPGLVIPWGSQRKVPAAVAIGTGKGVLIPRVVALEGRRPMGIEAFLPGHSSLLRSHLSSNSSA